MSYRKKLIEVALPLDEISAASIREKSLRHGHPSTLHLWWSRKPLATSRAVIFASMVDDPSAHPELFPTEEQQDAERKRLFALIKALVVWENSNNRSLLLQAHEEMVKYAPDGKLPPFLDPFAGGGSIPLEAQRLGLESHASDLNPVAVLLNKTLIEIPPQFANQPPVNPEAKEALLTRQWCSAQGLADDVRYYGKWLRDEAEQRIGHLYPKATLPHEYGDGEATVIAWLWVRTVKCPNPACGAEMPLASKWWLSKKSGNEAWAEPHVDYATTPPIISFSVRRDGKKNDDDKPQDGTVNRLGAKCIACGSSVPFDYIRKEGRDGGIGAQLIAIVADGKHGRIYLAPNEDHTNAARVAKPVGITFTDFPEQALGFRVQVYGMTRHQDLFTPRQLVALTTFSDSLRDVQQKIIRDHAGTDSVKYAQAVVTYLALAIDRLADKCSTICAWDVTRDNLGHTFARQAIPMVWDFGEVNPFSSSGGNFLGAVEWVAEVLENLSFSAPGEAVQRDAMTAMATITQPVISTDPPYYDNIGYADLSDFFYVWLRRSLGDIYPELFSTMLVPKAQELIATPYRFDGSKKAAQEFFEHGLNQTFEHIRAVHNPDYPLTVYYAFKQAEADIIEGKVPGSKNGKDTQVASTGWETMLAGLIHAGFTITGTWPIRTEMMNRSVGQGTNALASSILLVCRPRPVHAEIASRRQFINELRAELADALKQMQHGSIAPVDLAQASIGPGMAIYSRYSKVIESDGSPLSVRTALQLINRELDSVLADQEGEYDVETRWAVAWFEENAMEPGEYGRAEVLSKAKNASIQSMQEAGIVEAVAGKVRLLKRDELSAQWSAQPHHGYLTTWEVLQRTIHALDKLGSIGAGEILAQAPAYSEPVHDLAYRLHNICERKKWTSEALYYNMLVTSWGDASKEASDIKARISKPAPRQGTLL
jgi:Adenine-specific DNA methylase containing a Zn-ribbon